MKGRGNASETRKKGPNCSKNRQAHQKWRDGAGCSGEYFSSLLALDGKAQAAIENIVNGASDPYAYADSAEHREGINAFLAKRPPAF